MPIYVDIMRFTVLQPSTQIEDVRAREGWLWGAFGIAIMVILQGLTGPFLTWGQTTVAWEPLAEGLSVAVWEPGRACDDEVPPLIAVRVDPERYRFVTYHYLDEKLPAPLTIKEWQRRTGAGLLFNAGLFRDDYSYMGLLVKDGRSLGSKRHAQWQGLFVAEPTVPGLRKARVMDLALEPWEMDKMAYREAAQSLMLLDRMGKPRVRQTGKRAHQTIVAEARDGFILLLKTTDTVALWELATCLRSGFPDIHQAMVMDGGASSDLLIEGSLPEAGPPGGTPSVQSFQDVVDGGGMRHIPLPAVIGLLPRDVGRGNEVTGYSGK
ncbi:MAG: phosphodiester glycosidase family protein [Nitrospirales bacterium]